MIFSGLLSRCKFSGIPLSFSVFLGAKGFLIQSKGTNRRVTFP